MLIERAAAVPDVLIVRPDKHGDERGFLSETFKASALWAAGVEHGWAQDNHSFSAARGVVRALHFQRPPRTQAKLVRVVRGAVFDVAVDLRRASPTYGRSVAAELSAENWRQLYLPAGFAHGFCTLTDNTEVLYKMSAEYSPADEAGLIWNDPDLAIAWPVSAEEAILSARDRQWPRLRDFVSPF
jgi:dTDP-4-dehydrorhamnose 3,5-epimerase